MAQNRSINKHEADRIVAEARKSQEQREQSYRGQALKLYPWVCGRCAREFEPKNLHELTVHHRDHNHDNNPADGSNWELLCLYCHDNEHAKYEEMRFGSLSSGKAQAPSATHNPFANLKNLMERKS